MHPHRRRKKRPNYETRTVEINRGQNGFGFTISGQQPCILSCIVTNSPADNSGLRAGDFLISVNGLNVCKSPHDTVVQLIGNSTGSIRMTIAENYFSDSSEDELTSNSRVTNSNRNRPKYPHKTKNVRNVKLNQGAKSYKFGSNIDRELTSHHKQSVSAISTDENCNGIVCKALPSSRAEAQNVQPGPSSVKNLGFNIDVTDVSCLHNKSRTKESIPCKNNHTPSLPSCSETSNIPHYENSGVSASLQLHQLPTENETVLEYRAIVGYLGTIEMPKQIATSSKLQTVRSCIRKLRQEKRSPTTVLMTILPSCMTLKNNMGKLLAEYPSKRVNYVSCSSENDYRFFGLVTCATHQVEFTENFTNTESEKDLMGVSISNSCHVFIIDSKIVEHCNHISKAEEFHISCCVDPVSNTCLEFPNNAEYIVNIIRMMYSLKVPNGYSIYGKEIDSVLQLTKKSSSPISNVNFARHLNRAPVVRVGKYPRLPNRICVREEKENENYGVFHQNDNFRYEMEAAQNNGNDIVANSPQPSNHSEITTASSNSDSGIGFHNDCQNISDRILVVDFSNPRNNFNVNAPHFGIIPRSINMGLNRENKLRPIGIAGAAAFDMDSSFLSNTTPVVEGFGGQGRPLNHIDHVLLGNVNETSQPHAIFNANIMNISSKSKTIANESEKLNTDYCRPCNSNVVNKFGKTISSPTPNDDHILNVRATPEQYGYDNLPCTSKWDSKFHLSPNKQCDTSSITYNELPFDIPHTYDSVYTETEDHHYEMIKPKKYFGLNEEFHVTPEKTESVTNIKEQGVNAPSLSKRSSNCTESLEDVTVISARRQDCIHSNRNVSIDDISMYSSKSQDYVSPNSSKNKIKKLQSSVDDILIFGLKNCNSTDAHRDVEEHMFLHPSSIKTKLRKSIKPSNILSKTRQMLTSKVDKREKDKKDPLSSYRLSPKVFGVTRPSVSVDNLCVRRVADDSDKENTHNDDWKTCESWMTGHLEGTSSEPDLRYKSNDDPFSSEHASPFRRWAGSSSAGGGARDRALVHRSYRRPTSLVAAAAASDHDMCAKSDGTNVDGSKANNNNSASGGVAAWSLGLEHLLADPDGASAFAAFLAKEFSAENIRFWTACERYAKSSCPDEARSIFDRHLADRAPEPVNVDSHARTLAAKRLEEAPADLFTQAQKQIFNLMKFDSYPRFLRSDVHAECARSELRGEKSPYAVSSSSVSPTKLKKSLSNAEERRRGTILPWARARLRGGSKDRQQHAVPVLTTTPTDNKGPNLNQVTTFPTTPTDLSPLEGIGVGVGASCSLCRVSLPDHAATTVVAVDDTDGQTIRQLIDRLLDKRGIACPAYDVFEQGVTKALDVSLPSCSLGGRRVCVERRVVFRLELPNRRAVSVRCRPGKRLAAVLRPVLLRYCGPLATSRNLAVAMHGTALDLDTTVQVADGQRLQVTLDDDLAQNLSQHQSAGGLQLPASTNCRLESQPQCSQGPGSRKGQGPVPSLDEITNRVFEEVLKGKQEMQFEKTDGSVKSENCNSEHSSGIYGQYAVSRQHQAAEGYAGSSGASSRVGAPSGVGSLEEGGRPLVAKLRAGVRVQAVGTQLAADSNEFLENLRQTQKALRKTSHPGMSSNTTKFTNTTYDDALNGNIKKQTTIVLPIPAARNLTNRNNITKPSPAARTIISTANTKSNGSASNSDCLTNKSNSDEDNTMNLPLSFLNSSYSMSKSAFNSLENNETSPSDTTFCIEVGSTECPSNCARKEYSESWSENEVNCTSRVIEPPPLPPKPKVLPTKPSNWGHNLTGEIVASNIIQDVNLPESGRNKRMIYLDQPTSSFV